MSSKSKVNPLGTPMSPTYFPAQKKTDKEKNKEWFESCVDAGLTLANWNTNNVGATGVRTSRRNKVVNYNLYNDIVDRKEMERVINPYGLEDIDFPSTYKNYPLLNSSINLLAGEERKRTFNPMVTVINSDAVTSKLEEIDEAFSQFYIQKVVEGFTDEAKIQQEVQKFGKWASYGYKDTRERMASQVLKYLYHVQDLKQEFSRGFKDALICGEEIYIIEIYGGEPILRKGNPLNIYTLRGGTSYRVEDSDIIIEDVYLPIGEVIDRYHEFLKPGDVRDLEEGHLMNVGARNSVYFNQLLNPTFNINTVIDNPEDLGILDVTGFNTSYFNGSYDSDGNVRVTRVVWAGMRKMFFVSYVDEDGVEQKDLVAEQYVPDREKGEQVKEVWIKEWYEGTRVGNDLYVKCQPCDIQMRHRDNRSISHPGIVGTVFNTNSNKGRGLMDIGRDYQYLWNTFMYRTELAFTKYKGKIGILPSHLVPDGWDMNKWLYYAEFMGWAVVDKFNEGAKGIAKGKLAGSLNEGSTVIDLEMGNYIQNHIMMLDFIKRGVDELTGITPQRRGAIDNRETVGGVERSVQQSSHITEEWFDVHDNTRVRALRALLEAAKIAWKDKSFVREFVLDNGTKELLKFDYDAFVEASYGVDVSSASNDMQALQALRGLGERFLQAGGSLGIVADLYRTTSITDLQHKIEQYEQQKMEEVQQAQQAQQQQIQQQAQLEQTRLDQEYALEVEKLDREDTNKQLDRENDIYLAEIKAMSFDTEKDINQNQIPDVLEQGKLALENTKTSYERMNKIKELQDKKDIEDKKIALEEKKLKAAKELQGQKDKAALEREKLKAKTALKNKVTGEVKNK